jgi:L-ascorbate metabolism protein UlaG (beta-lactamase superfamily)
MNDRLFFWIAMTCVGMAPWVWPAPAHAQNAPQFSKIQRLTNREIVLTFSGQAGTNYRIDASNDVPGWSGLVTFPLGATASLQYTDSASPFLQTRFYRAEQITSGAVFAGDHLSTTNGDVIMQPRYHATLVLNWQGKSIYVDPYEQASYIGLPKADLILVTHSHSDHFNTATIDSVRATNGVIIAPRDVFDRLTVAQKVMAGVLTNRATTNLLGLSIEAIPAYNSYHTLGLGNGYVLGIGGKRIYISGDTSSTVEMRQLSGIDVAFLSMNQPYTMTVTEATNAVTAFRPKVVYPYHYRDQSGATASAAAFKQQLRQDLGVEVRLRKWY